MIEIDGAQGEGGGQMLRTSLSLAASLKKPVHIKNIRQGRKKPGLMRQHLASVNAMAEICNAQVIGAFVGSQTIEFIPGDTKAGNYHFAISSAGSSTLVFQTVMPALLLTGKPSRLVLEGGTHNPMAPSFDFIQHGFLPVLEQMGIESNARIERYGFYPAGGGKWTITIKPPENFHKIMLENQGTLLRSEAKCIASRIPDHVLIREKKQLLKRLDWPEDSITLATVESPGPGNIISLQVHYPDITEVVESIGERGISAEHVADKAADELCRYQSIGAPVGGHLADQLLLPLSLGAGGSFVTGPLSGHTLTNIAVILQFIDVEINVVEIEPGRQWRVAVNV
ncbi:RNA 3'-terminal phosphate cyclase [Methylobacter sp.]|uniref:RNA 3'-terminal phosphate cyclase n=1 Tax=Methylobacter sp. TaxID=2051955 RepID=UPI003DA41CBF